jgi:3-hydroxybutyryl-CoA dehydrogenase
MSRLRQGEDILGRIQRTTQLQEAVGAADLVIESAPVMDMVWLDVVRDIEMVHYRESGDASNAPPQRLLDKIARGELGAKTGKGFYRYPHPAFQTPGWLKGDED